MTFSGPASLRVRYNRAKTDCKRGAEVTLTGTLRAVLSGGRPYHVAQLPSEPYLRGVLTSEMPSSWPAEALWAQAVAARPYAASRRSTARFYDVVDITGDQCWDGWAAHTAPTDAAVRATAGLVATYAGRPINAQFSSDNGGWTAPGGQPYLPNNADPYSAAAGSPYSSWRVVLTPAPLAAADGAGGLTRVTAVRVTARAGGGSWRGRVVTIELRGVTASGAIARVTLHGDTFRFALRLRSTYLGFTAL